MHELALAEAVVAAALEAAEREGFREIEAISVRIGELQRIERDSFEFALREVLPASDPRLASTRISIETEPARFRCRACAESFARADAPVARSAGDAPDSIPPIPELAHAFRSCPRCQSADVEVISGRDISIDRLEGS